MRPRPLALFSLLLAVGCAGRVDPAADEIKLVLSEPSGGANVNLTRFDAGTDWQRSRPTVAGLTVTVVQNPGPTGITSRTAKTVIANASVGTQYSLTHLGDTYLELTESTNTGSRVWRSYSGSLTLVADETKTSSIVATNVLMEPYSGNAQGNFKVEGPITIRF